MTDAQIAASLERLAAHYASMARLPARRGPDPCRKCRDHDLCKAAIRALLPVQCEDKAHPHVQ